MKTRTAIVELLRVVNNRKWHSLYEAHLTFHLSPIEIFDAVTALQEMGIVERCGIEFRIRENLDEYRLSVMNRLYKSRAPQELKKFYPERGRG